MPAESGRRYRLFALLHSDIASAVLLVAREGEGAAERCSILPRVVLRSEGGLGESPASSIAAAAAAAAATPLLAAAPAPNRNFRSDRLSKGLLSLVTDPRFSGGQRWLAATAVLGRCLAAGGRGGERLADRGWRALRYLVRFTDKLACDGSPSKEGVLFGGCTVPCAVSLDDTGRGR